MKLTLTRRALKEAVAGFAKIVASRTALPVLGSVRFEAGRDGAVAEATNLDEHLRFRFPTPEATALEAGVLIVPLQALKDLCKGDARDTLLLESEGDVASVSHPVGGHTLRRVVEGIPIADWPAVQGTVPTLPASARPMPRSQTSPLRSRRPSARIASVATRSRASAPACRSCRPSVCR